MWTRAISQLQQSAPDQLCGHAVDHVLAQGVKMHKRGIIAGLSVQAQPGHGEFVAQEPEDDAESGARAGAQRGISLAGHSVADCNHSAYNVVYGGSAPEFLLERQVAFEQQPCRELRRATGGVPLLRAVWSARGRRRWAAQLAPNRAETTHGPSPSHASGKSRQQQFSAMRSPQTRSCRAKCSYIQR